MWPPNPRRRSELTVRTAATPAPTTTILDRASGTVHLLDRRCILTLHYERLVYQFRRVLRIAAVLPDRPAHPGGLLRRAAEDRPTDHTEHRGGLHRKAALDRRAGADEVPG